MERKLIRIKGIPITVSSAQTAKINAAYLISVHCDDREWAKRAKEILEAASGEDVVSTSEETADYDP